MPTPTALLPYPDKFRAAVLYVDGLERAGSKTLSDETRLTLYALHQQATVGPCKEPKPWSWNVVTNAKWQFWSELGNLPSIEAMRLYVRTLEEDDPAWHAHVEKVDDDDAQDDDQKDQEDQEDQKDQKGEAGAQGEEAGLAGAEGGAPGEGEQVAADADADADAAGAAVAAAAAAAAGAAADAAVAAADADAAVAAAAPAPSAAAPSEAAPAPAPRMRSPVPSGSRSASRSPAPAAAGSRAGSRGPTRSVADVVVDGSWVSPYVGSGPRPPARHDHAASLVGSRLVIAGGTLKGRALGDAWALGLEDLTWTRLGQGLPETARPPATAGGAAATVRGDLYLFAGLSHDGPTHLEVWKLDGRTLEWEKQWPGERGGAAGRGGDAEAAGRGGDAEAAGRGGDAETARAAKGGAVSSAPPSPGPCPCARAGQSATALPGRDEILVYGGEDAFRKTLDDAWIYDVAGRAWRRVVGARTAAVAGSATARGPGGLARLRGVFGFGGRGAKKQAGSAADGRANGNAADGLADGLANGDVADGLANGLANGNVADGLADGASAGSSSSVPPLPLLFASSARAPARSSHVAVALDGGRVLVHGGGSVATVLGDAWVLDVDAGAWAPVLPASGAAPSARAGHAAAELAGVLYVIGGGDNEGGCADMWALDLEPLRAALRGAAGGELALRWTLLGHTPPDSAIASEGASLTSVPLASCIVAFGGYNGKYHHAVHVYRPEGGVRADALAPDAAPARHAGDGRRAAQAQTRPHQGTWEPHRGRAGEPASPARDAGRRSLSPPTARRRSLSPAAASPTRSPSPPRAAEASRPAPPPPRSPSPPRAAAASRPASPPPPRPPAVPPASELPPSPSAQQELAAARRDAAQVRESAALELALLRRQLASAEAAAGDASEEVHRAQEALREEQARAAELEVQLQELKEQVARYREGAAVVEALGGQGALGDADRAAADPDAGDDQPAKEQPKRAGGLWSFISGADAAT